MLDSDHSVDKLNNVGADEEPEDEKDSKPTPPFVSADTFLISLMGHLQEKKLNIVYEDSTKICSSQVIGDDIIMEILDKMGVSRPQHD